MPKISVIMCSARDSYSLVDLPKVHLFEPTFRSLEKQTFKDFELVLVDALQAEREPFKPDFKLLHVAPKYSPYAARGQWQVCNQFNTGLIHCSGDTELVVRIDDASEFDENYLQRIWNWHTADLCPLSLVNYYRGGKTARWDDLSRQYYARMAAVNGPILEGEVTRKIAMMNLMYREGQAIEDSRLPLMTGEAMINVPWNWVYGYVAMPLENFLAVNGYDEAFDGKKSLEDPDLALRVLHADPKVKFALDKGLWAVENFHGNPSEKVIFDAGKPACCNFAILRLHERQRTIRANERRFTEQELNEIREETAREPCSHQNGGEFDLEEGFRFWAANIPILDIRKAREEAVAS